jgi:hypothetical protein
MKALKVLGIIVLGFVALAIITNIYDPRKGTRPQDFEVGHVYALSVGLAATSPKAYEALDKLLQANDKDGITLMALSGELIQPEKGDQVRILDVSIFSGRADVRLISGKLFGREIWVRTSWLEPAVP